MENLKNKIKELKDKEQRLDIFKLLTIEQAKELLLLADIYVTDCMEALNYEECGIHHYKFCTGKINDNYEKEIIEVDFHYNGDVYASIGKKTVLNLFD